MSGRRVLTALGAYETHDKETLGDSKTPNPFFGKPYDTISVDDLMAIERTAVAKANARWVLCSGYAEPDARHHKAQEDKGSFVMLAVDLDTGNVQGAKLVEAIQTFIGEARFRVYATSSATKDNRKWRVLIPTLTEMPHGEWLALTVALYRHIEKHTGAKPDYSLARAGQPIYLPNTPKTAKGTMTESKTFGAGDFNWRDHGHVVDAALAVMQEEEDRKKEHDKRTLEARRRMAQVRAKPDENKSVIEAFNEANDLEMTLTACGYKRGLKNNWRSPLQATTSFATRTFDEPAGQYWISLSESDLRADLGSSTTDGRSCFGDAFDVWSHFTHNGDRNRAIKAAANQLGIKAEPSMADQLGDMMRKKAQAAASPPAPAAVEQEPDTGSSGLPVQQAQTAPSVKQSINSLLERIAADPIEEEEDDGITPALAKPSALNDAFAKSVEEETKIATLPTVRASDVGEWTPPKELVEGMLIEGAMSILYGDSNTGKSFLALDMAAHVSLGLAWFGRRVREVAVLYVAAESPQSIVDRSMGISIAKDYELPNLHITSGPIDLFDKNGDAMAIVNTCAQLLERFGIKIELIVVDTVARSMGSGDENTTQDMGQFVRNIDLIRGLTDAHVMGIHHTGKDLTRGARGSSALRAATDTEIEVSDPGSGMPREFKLTKQRDLGGKGDVFGFHLRVVELGRGVFDNLVTTCVVDEATPSAAPKIAKLDERERDILDVIKDSTTSGLKTPEVVAALPGISQSTVYRLLNRLVSKGLLYRQSGQYRIGDGKPKRNRQDDGEEF